MVIFFVACMCVLFVCSSRSYASGYGNATGWYTVPSYMFSEETQSSEVMKDDIGRFTSGYFYYRYGDDSLHRRNSIFSGEGPLFIAYEDVSSEKPSLSSGLAYYRFYLVYQNDVKMLPIDASSTKFLADDDVNVETKLLPVVNLSPVGNQEVYYRVLATFSVITDHQNSDEDNDDWLGFYCTNLPVFEKNDQESIAKYLENGDYSGAVNADNINGQVGDVDNSIEKPRNLKVISDGKYTNMIGSAVNAPFIGDYIAHWEQTVDTLDYEYDVDVRFTFKNIVYNNIPELQVAVKQTYTSDWYTMRQGFPYLGEKNEELKIDRSVLNNAVVYNFVSLFKTGTILDSVMVKGSLVSYDIEKVQIRVRNRSGDKVSNYVTTTVDYKTGSVTASVTDKDDNKVDDEEYNDTDVDETTGDKDVLDAISDGDSSFGISGIMAFIKSGFGLLGDYGIIALMSRTYSYLPRSIWTIITFFISMLVVICVIKAIKEVLL